MVLTKVWDTCIVYPDRWKMGVGSLHKTSEVAAAVVKVLRRADAATSATDVGAAATSATPSKKDKPSGNRWCTSAIQEVASGVSVRSAARHHNIPRNTLKRRATTVSGDIN